MFRVPRISLICFLAVFAYRTGKSAFSHFCSWRRHWNVDPILLLPLIVSSECADVQLPEALYLLHQARRFVTEGEKELRYQRALIGRLERRGRSAGEARELLARIKDMQDEYLQHEERISNQVMLILKGR